MSASLVNRRTVTLLHRTAPRTAQRTAPHSHPSTATNNFDAHSQTDVLLFASQFLDPARQNNHNVHHQSGFSRFSFDYYRCPPRLPKQNQRYGVCIKQFYFPSLQTRPSQPDAAKNPALSSRLHFHKQDRIAHFPTGKAYSSLRARAKSRTSYPTSPSKSLQSRREKSTKRLLPRPRSDDPRLSRA